MAMPGEAWRLEPLWNGRDAWRAASLTTSPAGQLARLAATAIGAATAALVLVLVAGWSAAVLRQMRPPLAVLAWTIGAAAAAIVFGMTPRLERLSGPMLIASVFIPVPVRQRTA